MRTSFPMPVDIRTSVENEQAINSLVPRRSAASHPCGGPCKSSLPSSCSRNAGLSCTSSCCNLRAVSARHPPRGQREWLEPKCLWKMLCESRLATHLRSRSSGRLVLVTSSRESERSARRSLRFQGILTVGLAIVKIQVGSAIVSRLGDLNCRLGDR